MKYVIYRKTAFGESLLAATLVAILRDQGIDAVYWDDRSWLRALVDVPIRGGSDRRMAWRFDYAPENTWDGRSIMQKALHNFCAWSGERDLLLTRHLVPVKFQDEPNLPQIDVSICPTTSSPTSYRNWPFFPQLKALLDADGIRWLDVSGLRGNQCLNQVKKSRLYLGLETGMSHFVSSVVSSGLIIQSGYSNINHWSTYGYEAIWRDVPCRNCFLRKGCPHELRCMCDVPPEEVHRRILSILQQGKQSP
jgi:hypothetical protein